MSKWVSDSGEEFETEEEARDDVVDKMEWSDYIKRLEYSLTWTQLFEFARKQEGFYDEFGDEICEAENEFFQDYYHEEDDDEDNQDY